MKAHFDDLTAINVPFGLLDEDTQHKLIDVGRFHYKDMEMYRPTGWVSLRDKPCWDRHIVYRVKPKPKRITFYRNMYNNNGLGFVFPSLEGCNNNHSSYEVDRIGILVTEYDEGTYENLTVRVEKI